MKFSKFSLFLTTFLTCSSITVAAPATQSLEDFAIHAAAQPTVNVNLAAQQFSQFALMQGKNSNGNLHRATPEQCTSELNQLSTNSERYHRKSLSHQYKNINMVDGNIVMAIAALGGITTYAIIDSGDYCHKENSTNDAYWAAHIIKLSLASLDEQFSNH